MKILLTDDLWRDVKRIASGRDSISLMELKELLDSCCEANVALVVRCKRCIHARPITGFPKQLVCFKHKTVIDDENYFCASGESGQHHGGRV